MALHFVQARTNPELQRAYFRITMPEGWQHVAGVLRHTFPRGGVSVQGTPEQIALLRQNRSLEFRGFASQWPLTPVAAVLDRKASSELPSAHRASLRTCVLANYDLPQVWYGMKQLYRDPGLTSTSGGAGVNVAVLDTGAKTTHPDISRRITRCRDATGLRIKNGCTDRDGHGTNVASIIAADSGADGRGIWGAAPQANLWVYKVCSSSCWSDDIARALYEVTDLGAQVVNMSFGGSGLASDEKAALDYAADHGVLLVAAAGNEGPQGASMSYPAAYSRVMGVAAIDENEATADFSSRGVNDGDFLVEDRELDVAAAGVEILGAYKDGCYAYYWGTSQASPHVAGLAAKLWQGTGSATRAYLQNRARLHDLATVGDDTQTGFGLPTIP